jgi:site-specific recombinase
VPTSTILVIAYHILRDRVPYRDLGRDFFDRRSKQTLAAHMKRRLEAVGYTVSPRGAA